MYNKRKVERERGEHVLENISAIRRNLKLSQNELAIRCGVTQQFIQQIEKGTRNPSIKVLKRIASELNVSIDELVDRKAG